MLILTNNFNREYEIKKYSDRVSNESKFARDLRLRILKESRSYVPIRSGNLRKSATLSKNSLKWTAEYSYMIYYGIRPNGKTVKAKSKTGPGPYWVDRYLANNEAKLKRMIVKEVTRI